MRIVAIFLLAGCLGFLHVAVGVSQIQHGRKQMPPTSARSPNQLPLTTFGGFPYDPGAVDSVERKRRAKYNQELQTQIMADSRRLTQLSRELQEELERAESDGTLPISLFRKADDIIKLAKSVKDKMRRE
jgi:hypothetical protein